MRFAAFVIALSLLPGIAYAADQWQAREVARLNNCAPKKIEVYQATLGADGKTIYRVDCNIPKMTDASATPGPDALLIGCDESLCELMRMAPADKK